MSDYNVDDKAPGEQWTAANHNAMKVAVNSKQDKSNLVIDLSNPSNTEYPSTSAVIAGIAAGVDNYNTFKYRGLLAAGSDISTKQDVGFYILPEGITPAHASYPYGGGTYTHGGDLVVLKKNNVINQKISFNGDNAAAWPRIFTRTSNDAGTSFEAWYEIATVNFVNDLIAGPGAGLPVITSAAGVTLSDYSLSANDLHGFVAFINNTGAPLAAGTNIYITFEHPRTGLNCIITSPVIEDSEVPVVSPYGFPSSTVAVIRIKEGIPDGSGGSFFYHIS